MHRSEDNLLLRHGRSTLLECYLLGFACGDPFRFLYEASSLIQVLTPRTELHDARNTVLVSNSTIIS